METVPAIPIDHAGMEVLTKAECDRCLAITPVGRVAFVSDGDIIVLPVNYSWLDSTVVFRTAEGAKLEAAAHHAPVAFEIDHWDRQTRSGWSVLVTGTAVEVLSEAEAKDLEQTGLRPWAQSVDQRRWVRIRPDAITGRKIS